MIDCYATQPVYVDHLADIWKALTVKGAAGTLYCGRATRYAIDRHQLDPAPSKPRGRLTLVASAADLAMSDPNPAVMLNHGAGQTYRGDGDTDRAAVSSSYTGGGRRERVVANLCPGPADARACRTFQPAVPAYEIGVPRLDAVELPDVRPWVGFAWHWGCTICPECQPAWGHYEQVLAEVARQFPVLGHGHPRMWRFYSRQYERRNIEPVPHFDDLLERGLALLVADNTSVMYEAAYLGIPVVALNAPWYRRFVHHGLRFWSHVPGLQVDEPQDLAETIGRALEDPPYAAERRDAAVRYVYGGYKQGPDLPRAVAAIEEVLDGRPA